MIAGGVIARLNPAAWDAAGIGRFLAIASPEALAAGETADIVLSGDRLDRLAQLQGVLRHAQPGKLHLKIDAADQVMLDIAMAQAGVHGTDAAAGSLTLKYRGGARA